MYSAANLLIGTMQYHCYFSALSEKLPYDGLSVEVFSLRNDTFQYKGKFLNSSHLSDDMIQDHDRNKPAFMV